ncbi:hypothetical protein QPK87_08990 [Kamptonema cortianum]|nr:hypothetical protein [Kamptonema cortianum]
MLERSKKTRTLHARRNLRHSGTDEKTAEETVAVPGGGFFEGTIASTNRQMLHLLIHHPEFGPAFFEKVRYEWIPSDAAGVILRHVLEEVEHESFESVEKAIPEEMRQGKIQDLITSLSVEEVIPSRYKSPNQKTGLLEEIPDVRKLFDDTVIEYHKAYLMTAIKEREALQAAGNLPFEKQLEIQKEVIDLQRRLRDIARPS